MTVKEEKLNSLIEVDKIEIVSLVDSCIDVVSTVSNNQVKSFRQWTRETYSQEWHKTHTELPLAEHGFSLYIRVFNEGKTKTVLFDVGGSPDVIAENAKRMGLNLKDVDCIVLSHGHYDHFGGLLSVIKLINNPKLKIIIHEDMLKTRGSVTSKNLVRRYPKFPSLNQLVPAELVYTKKPSTIVDGMVCVTGEIPRNTNYEKGYLQHRCLVEGSWQPDPLILDERAIIINLKGKGLVVLSGCAHAGIVNTIRYAQEISGVSNVYAVIGGFHLAGKGNEERIQKTIEELKIINPKLIVPSHCTGWRAIHSLSEAFPEAFVHYSTGNFYQLK